MEAAPATCSARTQPLTPHSPPPTPHIMAPAPTLNQGPRQTEAPSLTLERGPEKRSKVCNYGAFRRRVSGAPEHTRVVHTSSLGSLNLCSRPFLSQMKGTKGLASLGAVKAEARFRRARVPQKVLGTQTPRKAECSAQGPPPLVFSAQPASSHAHLRALPFLVQGRWDLGPGLPGVGGSSTMAG